MTGIMRHKFVIALVIALLVGLNVWRWWPSPQVSAGRGGLPSATLTFRLEDFEVRALPDDSRISLLRDLFHPNRIVVSSPVATVVQNTTPEPPAKSPEELAHDAAQAEFTQMRCVGISVRDKRTQAYILNGGDSILVSTGDKVGDRFVVENIMTDGVVLRDPDTGVGGQIPVSGK